MPIIRNKMKTQETTQDRITEGNGLIAEFMGYTIKPESEWYNFEQAWLPDGKTYYPIGTLKFHASWDWLMPVVEKIEEMGWVFNVKRSSVWIQHNHTPHNSMHGHTVGENKKEAIFGAVVEFIKWHNQQKAKP